MKKNFLILCFLLSITNVSYSKNITLDLNKDKTTKDSIDKVEDIPVPTQDLLNTNNRELKTLEEIHKHYGKGKEAMDYIDRNELYHLLDNYGKNLK